MTLAIKLAIIAALILSIFIPFGYFLHGERTKKRYKRSIAFNAFFFFGIIVIAGVMMFVTNPVQAAQAGSDAGMATGLGYLAAALFNRTFLCWWWYRRSECRKCSFRSDQ